MKIIVKIYSHVFLHIFLNYYYCVNYSNYGTNSEFHSHLFIRLNTNIDLIF